MKNFFVLCAVMLVCFFPLYLLSLWTDRNLEFWLSFMKHSQVDVPQWLSFLVTIAFNGLALIANVIGEVVRLAV